MFRKTDPQRILFGVETNLPDSLQSRLKDSWAELFQKEVLAILLESEDDFAALYGITGRPNFSVARILGLCFLQELNDFSDQKALDAFGFDVRWQYALDMTVEDAYLSRRSLVEFRSRLVRVDPGMALMRSVFNRISQTAIDKLGISTAEQRVDSTHIQSNIHSRGRLALFADVLGVFLKSLDEKNYARVPSSIRQWHEEESNGWFGMGNAAERKAKLGQLARYTYRLLECFRENKKVVESEAYKLLKRLFEEQCEVKEQKESEDSDEGDDKGEKPDASPSDEASSEPESEETQEEEGETVEVKRSPKGGDTLQSAYDPDASYGHKGRGYSVHIAETCNNPDTPEIITDYEVHGAARSDMGKTPDVLDRLEEVDRSPEKLFADGGYPTVQSAYDIIERRGIELVAPVNRGPMDASVMGRDRFEFDDDGHVVSCPEGHPAIDHRIISNNSKDKTLHAIFKGDICRQCDKLETCPVRAPNHRKKGDSPRETRGDFRLEITPELCMRDDMLLKQQTSEWLEDYKIRSGVEATMSEMKRGYGMAKLRVRGLPRVHFAVVSKTIACNIKRWWRATRIPVSGSGDRPLPTAPSRPPENHWTRPNPILRAANRCLAIFPFNTCITFEMAA